MAIKSKRAGNLTLFSLVFSPMTLLLVFGIPALFGALVALLLLVVRTGG